MSQVAIILMVLCAFTIGYWFAWFYRGWCEFKKRNFRDGKWHLPEDKP